TQSAGPKSSSVTWGGSTVKAPWPFTEGRYPQASSIRKCWAGSVSVTNWRGIERLGKKANMNPVKEKLRKGEVVFGQLLLELFTPGISLMLANSGMDFVIYDMEHGRCDITLLAEMVASCRGSSI